jgi:hypothetical protein
MNSRVERRGVAVARHAFALVSVWAALAGAPASAATMSTLGYQTNAYYNLTVRNQIAAEEGTQLVTNASTTLNRDLGAVQFNGGALPGMKAYAFADIGQLKTLARTGGLMTSTGNPYATDFQATAVAAFVANVVFDTGTPGEAGTATFALNFDGAMSNRLGSGPAPQYALANSGADYVIRTRYGSGPCPASIGWCYAELSGVTSQSSSVQTNYLYTVSFVSGIPLQIGIELEAGAGGRAYSNGYVYGLSDFSHTLKWGGLVSATAGGNDITSSLQAGSGFDFISQPLGVPEPANWALMIGGFGVIGAVTRRRERRVLAA